MENTLPSPANQSLPAILRELWGHIQSRRKVQLAILLGLMVVAGVAEMVSLGALVPFIGVLVVPERLQDIAFVSTLTDIFGISSLDDFRLFLTVLFCGSALVAGGLRMVLYWASGKLAQLVRFDAETEVYRRTINQPFQVHISRHSSAIVDGIEKAKIISRTVMGVLSIARGLIIGSSIIITLFLINAQIATATMVVIGGSYLVISYFSKWRLQRNSVVIAGQQRSRLRILQESLGAIRDIILDGTHKYYTSLFRRASLLVARSEAWNFFLRQSPKVAIEMIGMVILAIVAFRLSGQQKFVEFIPVLSALALGAQRMLPVLQQAYSGWAEMKGNQAIIVDVLGFLRQPENEELPFNPEGAKTFAHSVEFRDVWFRYREDLPWVLKGLNLTIEKGARVGLIGKTGGGKSTILDLFMGLLSPTQGEILIDGVSLGADNVRNWRSNIAHVPQAIFLADGTISENIAFGVPSNAVDLARVQQAGARAQMDDFVERKPKGYDARVGERGMQLSGGQRQRIGIARALYKDTPVLVLDEATNALDADTEENVVRSIEAIKGDITLLLVSHRESILRTCDVVYSLEQDGVVCKVEGQQAAS